MRRGVILCGIAGWVGNRKELQKTLEKKNSGCKKKFFRFKIIEALMLLGFGETIKAPL